MECSCSCSSFPNCCYCSHNGGPSDSTETCSGSVLRYNIQSHDSRRQFSQTTRMVVCRTMVMMVMMLAVLCVLLVLVLAVLVAAAVSLLPSVVLVQSCVGTCTRFGCQYSCSALNPHRSSKSLLLHRVRPYETVSR